MEKEKLEKWRKLEEEARRIREESADWKFIEKQPFPIKVALKFYVKTGDLYVASRIAGVTLDEMNKLRIKAGIPNVA